MKSEAIVWYLLLFSGLNLLTFVGALICQMGLFVVILRDVLRYKVK